MASTVTDRLLSGSGVAFKAPCRVATTANITPSGEQTIDGVAVVAGDRVLVKEQTSGSENGIWICRVGAWERAPDWDGNLDVVCGTLVFVTAGTLNTGQRYVVTTTGTIVIGTTSVVIVNDQTLKPTFMAHKNGTNQTGIANSTDTKITFGTEDWDIGPYFADSIWTPPPGKQRISAVLCYSAGTVDGGTYFCRLYKNGLLHRVGPAVIPGAAMTVSAGIDVLVSANGSDTFEIYGRGSSGSTLTVSGSASLTWWCGETIA